MAYGYNYGYNDATINGSTLTNTQIGATNATMAPLGTVNTGGAVQGVDVTAASAPGITQTGGTFFNNADGSFNTNNLQLMMGGVQMLGNLWNSYQQQKIAKEQLSLARDTFQTNLENNRQTYNTALEDRIRSRYNTEGRTTAEADSYLSEHSL